MTVVAQVTQQREILEKAVAHALDLAQKGSDGAEVSVAKTTGISVSTRFGDVENVEFNSDGALSITVYYQQRKGSASSTDLSPNAIQRTVQAALDIARYTSPDPDAGLPDRDLVAFAAPDLDLFHPIELDTQQAIDWAASAERQALSVDSRITNSEGGSFNTHYGIKVFANSLGMLQSYSSSRHSISCCVIAQQDGEMERDYAYSVARDVNDLQSAEWVGNECAKRVISRLNPRKLVTQQAPVLFTAQVATGLFGHLASAITGSQLYRKSSFMLDHLGKQILPAWLTIFEQPHLPKGLASSPFDGEGVRTEKREIVSQGILQTYLLNTYSGRKLGMKSTGHAGGIHNWLVKGQQHDFTDLLKQMDRGLIVTELMGHGMNVVTGDYSRGASGFWVENGQIQYPVSGITIAGNLRDMLVNIVAVGNDIETRGHIQCGSVLLPVIKIAGD